MITPTIYTVGGTVQAGQGIYISRQADNELLELCRTGTFAYVLTARQMGKTSLIVRTSEELKKEGFRTAIITLEKLGTSNNPEEWYKGLIIEIDDELELKTNIQEWWKRHTYLTLPQRLITFLRRVVLTKIDLKVIIFIDEIDTSLSLDFTDDFFATIRSIYNERATKPELRRLSFVLVGVATPDELIHDPKRTPFNIGQRVELEDFSFEEAVPLSEGLTLSTLEKRQVLKWVLEWTHGHPYLTQKLYKEIKDHKTHKYSKNIIDEIVLDTFLGDKGRSEGNLRFVSDMLTRRFRNRRGLLLTYRDVISGVPVTDNKQSLIHSHLKLSGVVRCNKDHLVISNRIYEMVFNKDWISDNLTKFAPAGSQQNNNLYITISTREVRTSLHPNDSSPIERFQPVINLLDLPIEYSTVKDWVVPATLMLARTSLPDINNTETERARKIGELLFETIFPENGPGWSTYRAVVHQAKNIDPLHIRLSPTDELNSVPWELLWSTIDQSWIAIDDSQTLVRTPEGCDETLHNLLDRNNPLRVVVFSLNDDALSSYRRKTLTLFNDLLDQNSIEIEIISGPNAQDQLNTRLTQSKPIHILDIILHKDITENTNKQNADDHEYSASAFQQSWLLSTLKERQTKLPKDPVQLIILNAALSPDKPKITFLNNLAVHIVQNGAPAVVSLPFGMPTGAIHKAMSVFYDTILNGHGIDQAITMARRKIFEDAHTTLEWVAPILFVHPGVQELRFFSSYQPRDSQPKIITPAEFLEAQGVSFGDVNTNIFSLRSENLDEFSDIFVDGPLLQLSDNTPYVLKGIKYLSELRSLFLFAPQGWGKTSYRMRAETEAAKTGLVVNINFGAFSDLGHLPLRKDYLDRIKRATYEVLKPHLLVSERSKRVLQDGEARLILEHLKQEYNFPPTVREPIVVAEQLYEKQVTPKQLRDFLVRYFDEEDVRELCFNLDIDFEELPSQSIAGKNRELVQYARRNGLYNELVERCRLLRPNISWISDTQADPSRRSQLTIKKIDNPSVDFHDWIKRLSHLVQCAGFQGTHFMFDDLDRLATKAEEAMRVLAPLVERPYNLTVPNVAFKFFLPEDPYLQKEIPKLLDRHRDDFQIYRLNRWTDEQLLQMLNRRLQHYAHKADIPDQIDHFRQLCATDVEADIEMRLSAAANGSPRELIRLIERIIEQHCSQISDPSIRIPQSLIDEVLDD